MADLENTLARYERALDAMDMAGGLASTKHPAISVARQLIEVCRAQRNEGIDEERARVVAFLFAPKPNLSPAGEMALANVADCIQRGEHLNPKSK